MPDFLTSPFASGPQVVPFDILVRLLVALVVGVVVAWIYCQTRKGTPIAASFPTTLVLLSVLIAMVTQVIGDNVARAFSLVGALSIVRFRTVVRDTQDTAYVIFAVVTGMAVGAKNPWVALLGLGVVGLAAFVMSFRSNKPAFTPVDYLLTMRVGIGTDLAGLLSQAGDGHLEMRELLAVATAKEGISLNVTYRARLKDGASADELVKALNRLAGVQSVQMERRGWDDE